MHKIIHISEGKWQDIVVKSACYSRLSYTDLREVDRVYIDKVFDFAYNAKFNGFTYKATRGYTDFEYHRFRGLEGYKPRVICSYLHEGKELSVEANMLRSGPDMIIERVISALTDPHWIRAYGAPGGIVKAYLYKCDYAGEHEGIFHSKYYESVLLQDIELGRAREAVEEYKAKNSSISKKLQNFLVGTVQGDPRPECKLESILNMGHAVNSLMEFVDESTLIFLVRRMAKHHNECEVITEDDKTRILNLAVMGSVHQKS